MFWTSLLGLVGLQYCSSPPFPYWLCLVGLSNIDSGILNCYWSTMYFSFQFCWFLLHILIFWGSVVRCMYIHNCYIFLLYYTFYQYFPSLSLETCFDLGLISLQSYSHRALFWLLFKWNIFFHPLLSTSSSSFFFYFQLLCALIPKVSLLGEGGGRGVQDREHM